MTKKRPILRYHGGKWRLAPWIISLLPPHRIYVEPFGGGASVLLLKDRSYAEVYNDLDSEVVNVFRVMRDPATADLLRTSIELTPYCRSEFLDAYVKHEDPIEQARRTIVKSFLGFTSASIHDKRPAGMRTRASTWKAPTGFRANSNRAGTTPAHDWRHYPEHIVTFCERLRGIVIENRPAIEVIKQHDREDCLHYIDPPYPLETRDRGTDYTHEMTDEDHRELANVLRSVRGMVVLSGYPCKLYDSELFPDWYRMERPHMADGARKRTEVVWMNEAAYSRQHAPMFEMKTCEATQ